MATSTATLLFTDIVDSTRLWEREPDAMRDAVARHDDILRRAITARGGRVIVDTGDGVFAGFPSALGALNAVIAAQRALVAESWHTRDPLRVRMALHTGETAAIDGDPKGPAANRAARLMALASGGQILLSQSTADMVQDALPEGVTMRDLGEHALKSLARPERVCQLVAPGLLDDFPPLSSPAVRPNNLPAALTPFIGRERQMREVNDLLEHARLLTLTGPGGTGKSRLALEIAANRLGAYPQGAWLVELAPLADPTLVVSAIGGALRVTEQPGRSLEAALEDYLRHKRLLLILDNCEHLIDACARHADELLRAAPGLTVLATSREMLGVAGETAYRVPSLALPAPDAVTPDDLHRSEAVQLFVARAAAVQPGFALTRDNAPGIADICRRLNGIPLAIELAAARTRAFGVADIAARLDDRFRLLTGGSRSALPHQQTLRALVDWSWDLLSGPERRLLSRLSVFSGGWTLDAAEAICADPPDELRPADAIDEYDVLDLLASLVDKSLTLSETDDSGATRYRLLETIRQYARDRLLESGDAAPLRDRHAAHALKLADAGGPALKGPDLMPWLRRLRPELDNFRTALGWELEHDPARGLRLACALEMYWVFMGRILTEGRDWLSRLLERAGLPPQGVDPAELPSVALYARALAVQARLTQAQGEYGQALQLSEEAAEWARRAGDRDTLAMALGLSCFTAGMVGDGAKADQRGEEIMALGSGGEHAWDRAVALIGLARASARNSPGGAPAPVYHDELRRLAHDSGSPFLRAQMEWGAAMLEAGAGNLEAAARHMEESNRLFAGMGLTLFADATRSELAHLLRRQGHQEEARSHYRERSAPGRRQGPSWLLRTNSNLSLTSPSLTGSRDALRV